MRSVVEGIELVELRPGVNKHVRRLRTQPKPRHAERRPCDNDRAARHRVDVLPRREDFARVKTDGSRQVVSLQSGQADRNLRTSTKPTRTGKRKNSMDGSGTELGDVTVKSSASRLVNSTVSPLVVVKPRAS